ncbi:VCBS repeat-containing protein [Streptomyces kasugaensis]|uniref:VCBS repeat-containing protein n=1 Tax=Streptomyces kasugaensis TaxID=1946 RepID=A0A4Q9HWN1_STRKA|nr:VCBS repeat-containing protein [Streptomyces kasugaensis]
MKGHFVIFRCGRSRPHRAPRLRAGAVALLVGTAGLGLTPTAYATGASSATQATDRPEGDRRTETDALALARSTGKPVEVTSLRTERQEVTANPSGTLTLTQHAQPVRARKNGKLVPVDATLERAGDRIAPKATTLAVTFSGGGDTTLATLTEQGRALSLQWPEKLPAPQLRENEATYPEVLPGVDLKVRATAETVGQVLVVKSAEAAKNPELKQFHLGLKTEGLRIEEDKEAGTLRALNPAGQELFASATPRMWDSSTGDGGPAGHKDVSGSAAPMMRSAATASEGDLEPGVKSADVDMAYEEGKLTLTPDASLLNGKDTTFPVYIDPTFGGKRQAWTIAYKPAPNSSFWNGTGWGGSGKKTTEARVGYEQQTGGTARSFFQMDSKALAGAEVIKAQFTIVNTHSWSCQAKPVEIWETGTISASTTWNKQPNWSKHLETKNFAHGNESVGCGDKGVDFNVTSMAKDAAAKKWSTMTLGLRAGNESDTGSWKKFDSNPKLTVEYNRAPNAPTGYGSNPAVACHADPYPAIGNTDVQLHAKISDPDGGTVKARFIMWPTGSTGNVFDKTVSVTSGSIAKVTVPKSTFTDRASYSWQVRADDGRTVSAWTPNPPCRFTVYKDRPSFKPAVSSTDYPIAQDGDDAPEWGAPARTTGTFTLANGGSKDVVKYVYGLDQKNPTSVATPASPGGSVQVKLTPSYAGPHVLYVYGEDRAGNRSDTGAYLFYAASTGVKDKPGDLNGDGHPDKWAVDHNGKLYMYPGKGDGQFGARMAATDEDFQGDFKDALITRRGDFTNDGSEDLVTRHPDGKLWVYPNTGFGTVDPDNRWELTQFDEALNTARIDQLASAGDLTGDGQPDLLAKVGDSVWLLVGSPLGYIEEAYPLADSGWAKRTLIAPGDMTGDGQADLLVRDDTDGKLYLYRGEADDDTGGTKPASLVTGTPGVYGSGSWRTSNRPVIIAPGDANGDGVTDLWATTADGQNGDLLFYPTRPGSFTEGDPVKVGWSYNSIAAIA